MNRALLLLFLILIAHNGFSQQPKNTHTALLIQVNYGIHLPVADLADRFGTNFSIGGGLELITEKSNWLFGIKANNLFGRNVEEDVLESIRDDDGFIIGNRGSGVGGYSLVVLRQRGLYVGGHIGKLFGLSAKNSRSGIRATLGVGLLQHKVRIQDESGNADQIAGAYIEGYDQLTNGLALEQFIGYQYFSPTRGFNFYAGFEFTQAFTENRRNFSFATRTRDTTKRLDALLGFRVGWVLPIYIGEKGEDLIY